MARHWRAARLASIIRARLAAAATAARTGESLPGATTSWAASRTRPSPSALTAPNPATAAAVGARRGLTGSQRVSRPVAAMPTSAAQAVIPAATATRPMLTPRPGASATHAGRGVGDAEVARGGGGDPQQADQRAGRQQGDRDTSRQARGDLGPEAASDLDGVAELADRRQRGLGRRQPGGAVRVYGVQQPGAQFGHDAGPGPHRS